MKKRQILLLLILLNLFLIACVGSEMVRKGAEPIDKGLCKVDCSRNGMTFSDYTYSSDTCYCKDAEGNIITFIGGQGQ